MRKKMFVIAMLLLFFSPVLAFGAGSCVCSYSTKDSKTSSITKIRYVCTSDASGSVSSPTLTGAAEVAYEQTGLIISSTITPGSSTVQPTDLYDVELRTSAGSTIDRLGGLGDNCPNASDRWGMPLDEVNGAPVTVTGEVLTPYAANVGNAKSFTVDIVLKR